MQAEILAANPGSRVRILGVNAIGAEGGIPLATGERTIPLLQDLPEAGVWAAWNPRYRDVVILDGNNEAVAVFNLTDHNLALAAEYDALLDLLRVKAGE